MMYRAEALAKSVENSDIYKRFISHFSYAVENGLLSTELKHPDIDNKEPPAYALAAYLRERGYTVDWNDYIKIISVSWN